MLKRSIDNEVDKSFGLFADPGKALICIYLACIVFFLLLGSFSRAWATGMPEDRRTTFSNDVQRVESPLPAKGAGLFLTA